jgi:phage-related protein
MNWREQCKHEARALPPEQRQQVLDEIVAGQSIGQTCDKHGLSLAAVCGVVELNIVSSEGLTLNTKSV